MEFMFRKQTGIIVRPIIPAREGGIDIILQVGNIPLANGAECIQQKYRRSLRSRLLSSGKGQPINMSRKELNRNLKDYGPMWVCQNVIVQVKKRNGKLLERWQKHTQ